MNTECGMGYRFYDENLNQAVYLDGDLTCSRTYTLFRIIYTEGGDWLEEMAQFTGFEVRGLRWFRDRVLRNNPEPSFPQIFYQDLEINL